MDYVYLFSYLIIPHIDYVYWFSYMIFYQHVMCIGSLL